MVLSVIWLLQLSTAYTQRFKGEKPHPFVNAVNCRRKFYKVKKVKQINIIPK